MRIAIFGALAIVALVSCATPGSLSKKAPVMEFHTTKTAREVVSMISKKWAEHCQGVNTIITSDGYMISIMAGHAGVDATAVISEKDGVTSVRYSERIASLSPAWMSDAVSACR